VLPHLPLHRSCLVACCALAILWALILLFLFYFVSVQLLHFRRSSFIVAGRFFVLSLHSHPPRAGLFCVCICHCKPCVANARAEKKKTKCLRDERIFADTFTCNCAAHTLHRYPLDTNTQAPAHMCSTLTHASTHIHTTHMSCTHMHSHPRARASMHVCVCVRTRARTHNSHTITHNHTLTHT